MRVTIL